MDSRPFEVIDCEQRSGEWFAARCGRLTASKAADMLATIKKGEAASRRNLRVQLVVERLTHRVAEDGYTNAAMQRGIELEGEARAAWEGATGNLVMEVGFLAHRDLPIGCSPDGIVGDWDAGLELKVPNSATHLDYLRLGGAVPAEYVPQLTHSLLLTGLPRWHFASYDPRFPEPLQLYRATLEAKDVDLAAYELAVRLFLSEVDREQAEVEAMMAARAA